MENSQILIGSNLLIITIGLIFAIIYLISKLNPNRFSKYIERFSLAIIILSFGFIAILVTLLLIGLMVKVTMILLGY